jgi:glycosyltransferase involved in cell wall biosynthesis
MTGGRFAAVTRRLRAAGVDDRAVQLGELAYERYVRALACADVVALPYRPGAINLARSPHRFGEAMAAGRPIVTNAGGDIAEIVEREKVGVVAGASPAEYAAAIADLLLDGERRLAMGARARRLAEERLSWRLAAARVDELYRGLRPGPPPPG